MWFEPRRREQRPVVWFRLDEQKSLRFEPNQTIFLFCYSFNSIVANSECHRLCVCVCAPLFLKNILKDPNTRVTTFNCAHDLCCDRQCFDCTFLQSKIRPLTNNHWWWSRNRTQFASGVARIVTISIIFCETDFDFKFKTKKKLAITSKRCSWRVLYQLIYYN